MNGPATFSATGWPVPVSASSDPSSRPDSIVLPPENVSSSSWSTGVLESAESPPPQPASRVMASSATTRDTSVRECMEIGLQRVPCRNFER